MSSYEKFRLWLSLDRLREQHANYLQMDLTLPEITQDGIAESVIHRFGTCFDRLWNALKRYLVEDMGIPDVPNSPKPVLRCAFENDLLEGSLERWFAYATHRVEMSHDYSVRKAEGCLEVVSDFIADATALYDTLTGGVGS